MTTLTPPPVDPPRWLTNEAIIRALLGLIMVLLTMGLGHVYQRISHAETKSDANRTAVQQLTGDVNAIRKDIESTRDEVRTLNKGVKTIETWVIEQRARQDERDKANGRGGSQ